jgi:hypothetical protein
MAVLPTVRIASDDPEHNGFIVINDDDFRPDVHKKWVKPTRVPRVKKTAEAEAGAPEAEDGTD